MRFVALVLAASCFLSLLGCSGSGSTSEPKEAKATEPPGTPGSKPAEVPQKVRFLIMAGGFPSLAIEKGEIKEFTLTRKHEYPVNVTEVDSPDPLKPQSNPFGLKPGRLLTYDGKSAGTDLQQPSVMLLEELPIGTRLKDFRPVGSVRITGTYKTVSEEDGKTILDGAMNRAGYHLFEATAVKP